MTTTGRLGAGINGPVIVEAHYAGEPWQMLASSYARNGRYRVRWSLLKTRVMHVRIALPDGNYAVTTLAIS